jgi:hypothetical protein
MKNRSRILVAVLACGISLSAMAEVTATLDKNQVALGDTVQLSVQNDGSSDGQLNIEPLKQDFDVLGSSHGSTIQIINGSKSTQTQIMLVLAPKHAGTINIAPLQWGAQHSPALELTVSAGGGANTQNSGAAAGTAAGPSPVFLTATIDQKQPYVQAATLLTVKLYVGAQIERAGLDLPGNSDVLVKQIGSDRQSSEVRNGHNYQVIQRQYVLLPQRSGQISLKGPVLDAQIQETGGNAPETDSFFANMFGGTPFGPMMHTYRPLHLTGDTIELNVLARPAAAAAANNTNWLPAQQVTLEETWQPANGAVHAGEPITRHLHLSAVGLTGAQLPDLGALMQLPAGVKMYPDQTKIGDTLQNGKLLGSRDQDIALIAANPGRAVLPAIKLVWWDTAHKLRREADLPSRTLDILPAIAVPTQAAAPHAITAAAAPAATPASIGRPVPASINRLFGQYPRLTAWQWLSIVLVLLWMSTLFAWWFSRRRRTGTVPIPTMTTEQEEIAAKTRPPKRRMSKASKASNALNAFMLACRDNDAQSARRLVLEWAAGVWPEAPPRGLNALALRLADAKVGDLLRQLDRACYSGAAWQGASLAQAFEAPPKPLSREKTRPTIPGLYTDN